MASTFWNTLFSTSHINVPDPDIEQHAGNQDKDISSSPPHPSLSDPLFIPSSGATLHLWGAKLSLQATILQQTQAVHQQLLETIQTQVEKLSQAVESQAEILSAAKVEIEAASVALKEAESRKKKNKKQRKEKDFKNGEGKSNDKKAQLSFHEAQVERLDEDAEDEDDGW